MARHNGVCSGTNSSGCELNIGNEDYNLICDFVLNNSEICEGGGYIQYTATVFCGHSPLYVWLTFVAFIVLLSQYFVALSVAADSFFCPSIAVIVNHLKISQNIAGVTFLAFGNGAPDIFASIASFLSTKTPKIGLALGALLGAGMFLSTVIVAIVTLLRPFHVMRRPAFRDLGFFILTVFYVFFVLCHEEINIAESVAFVVLYIVYAFVVVVGRYIRIKVMASSVSKALVATEDCVGDVDVEVTPHPSNVPQFRRVDSVVEEANWRYDVFRSGCVGHGSSSVDYQPMSVEGSPLCRRLSVKSKLIACDFWKAVRPFSQGDWKNAKVYKKIIFIIKSPILMVFNLTIPTVNLDVENNNWSQPLTMVQCILAPLFLLFAIKNFDYMIYDDFSLWLILFLAGILMAVLVFTTSDLAEPPAYHKLLAYVGFVMSVLWIYSLATEVVGIITTIGAIGRVPEELLGLTVLAWSNSLGDLFTDVTVARQGFPRMAISACFGGPLFNVLLGIGIPLTIASIRNGNVLPICFNSITLILIIFLIWSLLSSIILLPLSRFHATRPYACYLLVVYATFLVVASFTAVKLIPEFSVPRI